MSPHHQDSPWDHPDWYDLHRANPTLIPDDEVFHEIVMALPPLSEEDHYVDVGTGTGRLATAVLQAYPKMRRVSLVDPNARSLEKALQRVESILPAGGKLETFVGSIGITNAWLPARPATVVTMSDVLMPTLLMDPRDAATRAIWLNRALRDVLEMGGGQTQFFLKETLGMHWDQSPTSGHPRRVGQQEFRTALSQAGFKDIECVYRVRDRVIFSAKDSD